MRLPIRTTARLGAGLIRILGRTWRIRVDGEEHVHTARSRSPHLIFAFWHGRMLPLSYTYRGLSVYVLASEHRDGELMGQTIRFLGFGHVRGSSTRGGSRAIRELVGKLREGFDLGITVDGPRGPRYVVKPGPVEIAKLSGSPIVPVTTGSTSHWVFASWDAFELPRPFARVAVRFGAPVLVPADADDAVIEEKRIEVQDILRSITQLNDEELARQSQRV